MELYFILIVILFLFICFLLMLVVVQKIWTKLSDFKTKDNLQGRSMGKIRKKLEFTNLRPKMDCKKAKNGIVLNPLILGKKLFYPVYIS